MEEAAVSRSADHMVDNPEPGMMSSPSAQSKQQKEGTKVEPWPERQGRVQRFWGYSPTTGPNSGWECSSLREKYQVLIAGFQSRAWRSLSRAHAVSNFIPRRAQFLKFAALPAQAIQCISRHAVTSAGDTKRSQRALQSRARISARNMSEVTGWSGNHWLCERQSPSLFTLSNEHVGDSEHKQTQRCMSSGPWR